MTHNTNTYNTSHNITIVVHVSFSSMFSAQDLKRKKTEKKILWFFYMSDTYRIFVKNYYIFFSRLFCLPTCFDMKLLLYNYFLNHFVNLLQQVIIDSVSVSFASHSAFVNNFLQNKCPFTHTTSTNSFKNRRSFRRNCSETLFYYKKK